MSRNNSSSILQSLTATYTDSEGEEEAHNARQVSPGNSDATAVEHNEKDAIPATTGTISTASPDSVKSGTSTPQSGSSLSGKISS